MKNTLSKAWCFSFAQFKCETNYVIKYFYPVLKIYFYFLGLIFFISIFIFFIKINLLKILVQDSQFSNLRSRKKIKKLSTLFYEKVLQY